MISRGTRWAGQILLAFAFATMMLWAGLWLGGAFALGRTDAPLAIPMLMLFALAYLGLTRRLALTELRAACINGVLAVPMVMIVLHELADGWRDGMGRLNLGLMTTANAAAIGLGLLAMLGTRTWGTARRGLLFAALAVSWWLLSHLLLARLYSPDPSPMPGRTMMLTGLPLVQWNHRDLARGAREDAVLIALRARLARPLVLVDNLDTGSLRGDDRLLLAHPHALTPAALVEIDRFVRAGGRAVILADGLSGWPPQFGFGDPRNPPVTSLLTPLLSHWGIDLAVPSPLGLEAGEVRRRVQDRLLALHSPGSFVRLPRECVRPTRATPHGNAFAFCRIGRGQVTLVADADLLFAPLWQSDPAWARHLRHSDNLEWLAEQVNGPRAGPEWGLRPTWRPLASD